MLKRFDVKSDRRDTGDNLAELQSVQGCLDEGQERKTPRSSHCRQHPHPPVVFPAASSPTMRIRSSDVFEKSLERAFAIAPPIPPGALGARTQCRSLRHERFNRRACRAFDRRLGCVA